MGSIGWFAKNSVAANLLMLLILTGGLITVFVVRQEVFPEFSLDLITVTVEYRGAAPAEVEEGVCVRIEEAIQGLDGVKRVTSVASEGFGTVTIELLLGADGRKVLDDVKARVDAIDTFPAETEKAVIREITNRRQVIDVAVWGDAEEKTLRHLAEQVRDELSVLPEITLVELANARPYEVSIEVSEQALRRYGLTFDAVANAVRRSSLDLPGGSVKTEGGEILLRTKGQAYRAPEFEELVLISRPDGTHLRLGAVASVVDGFADTDQATRLDGKPAFQVQVFRVGNQDALSIADAVFDYMESAQLRMPDGVHLSTWQDSARILRSRRNLLLRNAIGGLLLVFGTLALFLRFRLAFWVVVGMLISFMGAIWLMPTLDVSINMISLFAFILVLGIVVDDAIVAGENIYTHQHRHGHGLRAAIEGAREVSVPVVFAVLTTVAAFVPLLFVAGTMGKVMRVIPLIVIPCLLWSLVESLWILPAHLSHYRHKSQSAEGERGLRGVWHRFQYRFAQRVEWFVFSFYSPVLEVALRWRYVTLAVGVSTLLITLGFVSGGHMRFIFFPDVESDYISAALTLPPGTPAEVTSDAVRMLEGGAEQVRAELEQSLGADQVVHRISAIGEHPFSRSQSQNAGGYAAREMASHLGEVTIELLPAEDRGVSASEIAERWRDAAGLIPDAIALDFTSSLFEAGNDVDVQLTGPDIDELRDVALELKRRLATFNGVYEIADSFRPGKEELKLTIKPAAEVLGLTLVDLGRQVRQAFYGEEAQRIQRGRDDVRVMVRYPVADRRSLGDLENMRALRPPRGRLHAGGPAGRATRHPDGAGQGIRHGGAGHLRPARRAASILRTALRHHAGDPLRPGRRGVGSLDPRSRPDDPLHVRTGRADRRRGQRQPGDGRLHQPATRDPRRVAGRRASGRRRPLPADPAHLVDHLRRTVSAADGAQHAGALPDSDGRVARLRSRLRHLHHPDPHPLRLPDHGGHQSAARQVAGVTRREAIPEAGGGGHAPGDRSAERGARGCRATRPATPRVRIEQDSQPRRC
jgi:multidrug efflux pump subunit AcrB